MHTKKFYKYHICTESMFILCSGLGNLGAETSKHLFGILPATKMAFSSITRYHMTQRNVTHKLLFLQLAKSFSS
jgi:hypothetical protein